MIRQMGQFGGGWLGRWVACSLNDRPGDLLARWLVCSLADWLV